jgi:hypothetical protein
VREPGAGFGSPHSLLTLCLVHPPLPLRAPRSGLFLRENDRLVMTGFGRGSRDASASAHIRITPRRIERIDARRRDVSNAKSEAPMTSPQTISNLGSLIAKLALPTMSAAFFAATPLAADAAPRIAGNVLQDRADAVCFGKHYCAPHFSPVPAGKSLIVTDVACSITLTNAANFIPLRVTLFDSQDGSRISYPIPHFMGVNLSLKIYQIQDKVRHILPTGATPVLGVELPLHTYSPYFYVNCSLTGDLV